MVDIVDAPPPPAPSFSLQKDRFLNKRGYLYSLAHFDRSVVKLAGISINTESNTRSLRSCCTEIGICQMKGDDTPMQENEVLVSGLPHGAMIDFERWSKDGRNIALAVHVNEDDGSCGKPQLWVASAETGEATLLMNDYYLNGLFDCHVWVDDSTILACAIPPSRGDPPKKPPIPLGPKIQSNEEKKTIQVKPCRYPLMDEHDEDLFDYYATSQLVLVSFDNGTVEPFGEPAVYTSLELSPDGNYILISSIHRDYSFEVPFYRFPKKVELWTAKGKYVREVCDLPLANIPVAHDSVRKGKRFINWRADRPSTLYWVETQDGGNAKVKVSPRDIVYMQPAEPSEGEQPNILIKLDRRYSDIYWCDDDLALVEESCSKTQQTRTWVISPGSQSVAPRILFDRSSEDVYSDPGSPMLRTNAAGEHIIAKIRKQNDNTTYVLLNGEGATRKGKIPFLDLLDINTGNKERIWRSDKKKYYEKVVNLFCDQDEGDIFVNHLKICVSRESKTECPQYYELSLPDKKASLTVELPYPYPGLDGLQKEMIKYRRKDGVRLTATLYLPPGYDALKEGPLPCLIWVYPEEFKSRDAAGQVRSSPNEFVSIYPTSPLLWLARGFAVLDGPTIPIIGEGPDAPNDSYIEQLVAGAEAAVKEVIQRGVADPSKIAIGGHSYGAFTTANLLAHAPHLFCCGIARSGAYNRTLTPFGFQNEDRTFWEAPKTYLRMSPLLAANKIKKPILLIHGEEDDNPGTLTMQSDRFFNALQGNKVCCRLVTLPCEGHSYVARESIMHVLWEMDRWLQKYCVSRASTIDADFVAKPRRRSCNDRKMREYPLQSDQSHRCNARCYEQYYQQYAEYYQQYYAEYYQQYAQYYQQYYAQPARGTKSRSYGNGSSYAVPGNTNATSREAMRKAEYYMSMLEELMKWMN